jgi:hypothetical protein
MKTKNKIWFTLILAMGVVILLTNNCTKSDNTTNNSNTGTANTASGTYTWNSSTGVLTFTWTSSTFKCNGPDLGTETQTGVTITSTTMTWTGDNSMIWTRSGGNAGDIIGKWTATDNSTGNSYTFTFTSDGKISLIGNFVVNPCISAGSEHWANGYYVELSYEDPNKTATSVIVTGPGITNSMALTYDKNNGQWDSWTSPSTNINFGMTHPTLPLTYTFSITDATGTWTSTSKMSCFQESFATNLSPIGQVTGTPTFNWTGINDVNALYQVQLSDVNFNSIWNSQKVSNNSILYNGPALSSGMTYNYAVVITHSSSCDQQSLAQGSFTYQ